MGFQSTYGDDLMKGNVVMKPPDQLELSEKELKEEHTRILTANNPQAADNIIRFDFAANEFKKEPHVDQLAVHFNLKGNLIHVESDEAKYGASKQLDPVGKISLRLRRIVLLIAADGVFTKKINIFKFFRLNECQPDHASEAESRASHHKAETEKPIRNQFNFGERSAQTVTQLQRERDVQTEPPKRENISVTINQHVIYDAYKAELARREAEKEKSNKDKKESPKSAAPVPSSSLEKSLAITERIVNQNTHLDIADDFRFFEDESDEYRDSEGTLLPLWIYNFVQAKKLSLTSTQWSSKYHDLFAVGLGSYNYARQGIGYLLFYSLKNPSYPGFIFETDVGVMCLDISTAKSHLVAVGLYDGSVAVFNLLKKEEIYRCKTAERHVDPVWAIKWQNDQFCSVSSDGMVKCWNPKTGETKDVITLYDDELAQGAKACGVSIAFHSDKSPVFLVGSEEGVIYKCSTAYSSQYLGRWKAHSMAVSSIKWNPFHKDIFLSSSDDWLIKVWSQNSQTALFSFDLQSPVGDISWSIFSSTAFGAVTSDGKCFIYDLNINKYQPLCEQVVVQKKKTKITKLEFNPEYPVCLIGDSRGNSTILKMSPNLRKRPKKSKKDPTPLPVVPEQEMEKMEKIVAVVFDNSVESL
ncbi:unnamed protein product [Oikopleura dioica]|uniref:Uncharacterized protein n=1 Tax=Oikopleura dioica TaxID=34765 RepID=E4YG62_OIKDI|nr:unnamed protein product [Oikopleura dioica]